MTQLWCKMGQPSTAKTMEENGEDDQLLCKMDQLSETKTKEENGRKSSCNNG